MSKYDDIINLKHYEPKHPRMSRYARSAQFAPFAALTGYDEQVKETARLTNKKIELSEDMKYVIDMKLQLIEEHIKEQPEVTILYFEKDKRKSGGKYLEYTGNIKRIDNIEQLLIFKNNKKIFLENIYDITYEL